MVAELISFGIGANWISKFWSRLKNIRKSRSEELEKINLIIFGNPVEIARYYVEPDCQDRNPADREEEFSTLSTTPVMKIIDNFFRQKYISEQGSNQMFILSDAGMGKTSLLTILKLMHLTSFWPQQKQCVLKKLGEKTINELSEIPNTRETILLLDSLDEDPKAYGRVKERLLDVLRASQNFFRVIITCRTQFFPEVDKDHLDRLGMFSVDGFTCQVKYLSYFSDQHVMIYLNKRFPKRFGLLPNTAKIQMAQNVINKMGALRCRPMLLAYIEDIMGSPLLNHEDNEYRIYDVLVKSWLKRDKHKDKDISEKHLLDACMILATWMQSKKIRNISELDLDKLIEKISKVKAVKKIHIKGRSLLNRNSKGNYRFSHYSVQEFLVAKLLLDEQPVYKPKEPIPMTDFIFKMITLSKKAPNFPELLDWAALNFRGMDLKQVDFSRMNLCGLDFSGAGLEGCKLSKANLKGSCFDEKAFDADFEDADLTGVKIVNGKLGMTFVYIPPGKFMMGDEQHGPVHEVTITKGFFMQTTPVTQGQWKKIMDNNPSDFKECGLDCPVENVSWIDVQSFLQKLNEMKEGQYGLPTEAQWEYACRAGSTAKYCFGDQESQLTEYAWYEKNSEGRTHPVAQLKPNEWGLYDMHGNVWEWCEDHYHGNYDGTPDDGSVGVVKDEGAYRVLRGGSWHLYAVNCRSAYRIWSIPVSRGINFGFRLARLPGQPGEQSRSGKSRQEDAECGID